MGKSDLIDFVKNGRKIIGAAINHRDNLKNPAILETPKNPVIFLKPTTSYITEGEPIVLPKALKDVFFEVELGVIIGRTCKNVTLANAMDYVGGYCLSLDMTAMCELLNDRAKGYPWGICKTFDTATPVSKFISKDLITDPHNLRIWLSVNGEMKQDGNTSGLIHNIPTIISYLSQYMTLEENDLILTGTPDGIQKIVSGDVIRCGLDNFIEMSFNVE